MILKYKLISHLNIEKLIVNKLKDQYIMGTACLHWLLWRAQQRELSTTQLMTALDLAPECRCCATLSQNYVLLTSSTSMLCWLAQFIINLPQHDQCLHFKICSFYTLKCDWYKWKKKVILLKISVFTIIINNII
jgi:hypothetical protein